ncbi:transporter substrate-binding domain-containing protein [Pantoea sp. LMR881]|uniref:transporter substrate-binding domain-containing protein n=1 Tax=Pantoea sp. LMR881 TaxID=3014336 RepID=UPI0022AF3350|nr:transporter substrate-binding domain-containing protein [Pantoea sp. LMR881]MCZ4060849.1 transporter substrate-binding domain-containing protein [Pantoea sp. LMR881]
MKRTLITLLVLACSSPVLTATAKEIRFGVDPGFAPYESKNSDGRLVGFDIDLGNAICAHLKAKCVWVEGGFDALIPSLQARKFDAILSAMNITEKREKQVSFTNKLYNGPTFLVARKNTLSSSLPEALKGKTLGVEQGSIQEMYALKHWQAAGVQIIPYQGTQNLLQDLEVGRLDGAVLSGVMADYSLLRKPQGADFAFVGSALKDDDLFAGGSAIAVRKNDDALKNELNGAIAAILADGTYKKLAGNYFSFDIYSGQ